MRRTCNSIGLVTRVCHQHAFPPAQEIDAIEADKVSAMSMRSSCGLHRNPIADVRHCARGNQRVVPLRSGMVLPLSRRR